MRYEIVPATQEHAVEVAATMRECDRMELKAAANLEPLPALEVSLRDSIESWALLADGHPVLVCGLAMANDRSYAIPWMLGSEDLVNHAGWFLRHCKPMLREWLKRAPVLWNYIDARNTVSIRWLRWLGFRVEMAVPYGVNGEPFHLFYMRG